jgi:hypothetical protein
MGIGSIYPYKLKDEFHYFMKPIEDNVVLAISSRKKLDDSEVRYLMINIKHVHIRPEVVKITLDDIIKNPWDIQVKIYIL